MTKRKCEVDFVYLYYVCGMTFEIINDTMPHTCYMQNGIVEYSQPYIYKK